MCNWEEVDSENMSFSDYPTSNLNFFNYLYFRRGGGIFCSVYKAYCAKAPSCGIRELKETISFTHSHRNIIQRYLKGLPPKLHGILLLQNDRID